MQAVWRQLPLLVALTALALIWYAAALHLNRDAVQRVADTENASGWELAWLSWGLERPVLPAPHQVGIELWETTVNKSITSKRSLIYHAWRTMAPTALGFVFGLVFGVLLAVLIVHSRAADKSVMPGIIASQTIPILAIAPMIVVVLGAVGLTGLVPKAIISAYLSFFPITVGMVKGLRSPDLMQLDLMRSYSASQTAVLYKLRLPASLPYLFASMKIGAAAALVGAIVGELPTGAQGGLGSRLLSGSYYGQTIQIWSALFMAAAVGALLVAVVALLERRVCRNMGQHR